MIAVLPAATIGKAVDGSLIGGLLEKQADCV